MVTRVLDTVLDRALLGYGNVGYVARSRGWAPVPRMDGKVVLVTGAKAGLGRAIVEGLVALGATVRVLIRGDAPSFDGDVHADTLDVSSLAAVREYAYDGPVHALIHNAGVMPDARTETAEGHELALATHVLGPHLLTRRLRPERVIWVSSGGMYTQKLRVDDLEYRDGEYSGTTAYARTKRMQVVLSELWARERLSASGHPGWVDTPGSRTRCPSSSASHGRSCAPRNRARTPSSGSRRPTCPLAASGTIAARGRRITCPSRANPRPTGAPCGTTRRHPARLLECSSRCPSTSSKKPKNRSRRCARRPSATSASRSVRTCAASRSPIPQASATARSWRRSPTCG